MIDGGIVANPGAPATTAEQRHLPPLDRSWSLFPATPPHRSGRTGVGTPPFMSTKGTTAYSSQPQYSSPSWAAVTTLRAFVASPALEAGLFSLRDKRGADWATNWQPLPGF